MLGASFNWRQSYGFNNDSYTTKKIRTCMSLFFGSFGGFMAEKRTKKSEDSSLDVKRPIARAVSQRLAVLIVIVTILVSVANYFYSMASTEALVREQLMKYSRERGLRESALFLESDAYQLRFQKEYEERYKRMGDKDPGEWFEEHMVKRPEDGTYRSKPELHYGKDMPLGRRDVWATMMIGARTEATPEVIKALAIGYDMVNQYGPAWRKPFDDLYFSSLEKTSVSRWPGTPWGLMMDDQVEWTEEEWVVITTKEKNPQRGPIWSGVLFDERNGNWMVSNVTPLDIDGKQVGLVGTDLLLDDLVERTINETLSGTYNILLQTDGRIIAHPHMKKEIIAGKGKLTAQSAADEHLLRIYERARAAKIFPAVIDNHKDNEFLAVTRIEGPDWYFITIYPKSLLRDKALRNAGFTLLSGLGSLVVMLFVILFVLKRNLVYPLGHLTQTIRDFEIGRGQWLDRADAFVKKAGELGASPDETGLLARSFVDMGDRLRTTYSELEESKKDLELKVTARTEALANAKDAAEAANRAKSIFLANMSHELRTPLNAILGFTQIIRKNPEDTSSHREDLDIIIRSAEHLLTLIDDVIDIARIEAGYISLEWETFDLGELVRSAIHMMRNRAEVKNLRLTLDQSSDFPRYIHADSAKVRQILINLISNAIQYTETGGITIRLDAKPEVKKDHVRLICEVKDTGIGISKEDQDRIFNPFEQALQRVDVKGTGLGLAITRQYAELMGGGISVESEPGKGSLFRIEILAKTVSVEKMENEKPSHGPVMGLAPGQPDYRILIVEDQLENRLLLKKLLEPVGFDVREALNGEEAITVFKEWKPHYIWMDRRMPVMDGLTATRSIKNMEGGKETVIVALTASVFKEQRNEVMEAGSDDFIRKPFREAEIFEAMAQHLGVRYRYAESAEEIEPTPAAGFVLTSADMVGLPHNLLTGLQQAAMGGQQELCMEFVDRIVPENARLAEALKTLVREYHYDKLVKLASQALESKQHEQGQG